MQASREGSEKGPLLGEALGSLARSRHLDPDRIIRSMGEYEPFREICTDYEECCAKLSSFEQKGADRQVKDYREMRDDLERDLLRHLEGADACWKRDEQEHMK